MQSKVVRAAAFAAAFALSATVSFYANAADLPDYGRKYNPPAPVAYGPPVDNAWGGFYAGGVLGYGWGDVKVDGSTTIDVDGILGGGLLGWNYQADRFVIGLEGDLLAAGIDGSEPFDGGDASAEVNFLAELRARAGFLLMPNLLLFASLGGAWADFDLSDTGAGGGKDSHTFSGLQYGAGAEVKITPEWSARFDYLYTDYDSKSVSFGGGSTVKFDPDIQQVRGSLVYRF